MIVTGNDGVEVTTSEAVTVPAGNPPSYGIARVLSHAIVSGSEGNIAAFDINQVYGTSLYIRNLQHFTGGKDAYSVMFATAQDRATALTKAHVTLMQQIFTRLLYQPCVELVTGTKILQVTWTCQFFTYNVPSLPHVRVLHVRVVGKTVFLAITYTQRPKRLETK
jgi:hypothetical protein